MSLKYEPSSEPLQVLKRGLATATQEEDQHAEAKMLMAFGDFYKTLWISRRALDHYERAVIPHVDRL